MLCSRVVSRQLFQILERKSGPGITFSSPNSVRFLLNNKHKDPRWKKFRALKMIKIELPDFHKKQKNFAEMTPEEMRAHYKEVGMQPHRPWYEREIAIYSTGAVMEPYVPPEGDGKASSLNTAGAKQKIEWLKKKGKSWKDLRRIRSYDDDFDLYPDFVDKAQEIYIKVHDLLTKGDHDELIHYATEKAFPEIVFNTRGKTIRWKFLESLEPPRVSHIRCVELLSKQNVYAQITVRFHTKQTLAIYDRFGRLIHGSETIAKDVLEYVVFEKHLSSEYGVWRMHAKIIPDWLPEKEPSRRTYVEDPEEEEPETQDKAESEMAVPSVTVPGPSVVTA